jgi:DNA-binding NarL/FixJ family response regulator
MITLRTAVVTMSPMLRDIISELSGGRERIKIVAEFATRDRLQDRLRETLPDIVLIELARDESDQIARTILAAVPCARVVAFAGGGCHVYIHEMRPCRTVWADASVGMIIRALQAPRWRRGS